MNLPQNRSSGGLAGQRGPDSHASCDTSQRLGLPRRAAGERSHNLVAPGSSPHPLRGLEWKQQNSGHAHRSWIHIPTARQVHSKNTLKIVKLSRDGGLVF